MPAKKEPKKAPSAASAAARRAELPAFTIAGIRRAARRAGCEQMTGAALERACERLEAFLAGELAAAASLAAHCNRRRILPGDIDFVASHMGAGSSKVAPQRFIAKTRRRVRQRAAPPSGGPGAVSDPAKESATDGSESGDE